MPLASLQIRSVLSEMITSPPSTLTSDELLTKLRLLQSMVRPDAHFPDEGARNSYIFTIGVDAVSEAGFDVITHVIALNSFANVR